MDIPIIHYILIHYKYLSEGLADTKKDNIEDILKCTAKKMIGQCNALNGHWASKEAFWRVRIFWFNYGHI